MRFLSVCVFIVAIGVSLCFQAPVHAVDFESIGDYRALYASETTNTWLDFECHGRHQAITLASGVRRDACVYGTATSARVSVYRQGAAFHYAIAQWWEGVYFKISGCSTNTAPVCIYSATYDVLFAPSSDGVRVYSDFSRNVRKKVDQETLEVVYSLGESEKLYAQKSSMERAQLSLSENGRFLVVLVQKKGYVRYDIEQKAFSWIVASNHGHLEGQIFTITNDGYSMVGMRSGRYPFVADAEVCPESWVNGQDMATYVFTMTDQSCRLRYGPGVVNGSEVAVSRSIRFSPDDTRLYIQAIAADMKKYYAAFLVGSSGDTQYNPFEYIALGDSFTSGEGETNSSFYRGYTNELNERCHTSLRSYPYIFASSKNLSAMSVACSGAVMGDILGSGPYDGQGGRLSNMEDIATKQKHALEFFVPGRVRQAEFIRTYTPKNASVGVGGNDIGLMQKLVECVSPGVCYWATLEGRTATVRELEYFRSKYTSFMSSLKAVSPTTTFTIVGYPLPINSDSICVSHVGLLLAKEEREYMNYTITYLNQIIADVARVSGMKFIDASSIYDGNRLCDNTTTPAMNGVRFLSDTGIIAPESFHPTPYGHTLMSRRMLDVIASKDRTLEVELAYWGETPLDVNTPLLIASPDLFPDMIEKGEVIKTFLPTKEVADISVAIMGDDNPGFKVVDDMGVEINTPHNKERYATFIIYGTTEDGSRVGWYDTVFIKGKKAEASGEKPDTFFDQPDANSEETQPVLRGEGSSTANPQSWWGKLFDMGINESLGVSVHKRAGYLAAQDQVSKDTPSPMYGVVFVVLLLAIAYLAKSVYNRRMNIRSVIKKSIPRNVFKKIEPTGHLFEAIFANVRYGFPSRKMRVIGVTGTNGKTTTSTLIYKMLHNAGFNVAVTTTVGYGSGGEITPQVQHITTAQAGILQQRLKDFKKKGVEWVIVETSSHALAQYRVWGVPYEIAVMTNVTHDHLDYHGTFDEYVRAKTRLFSLANKHGVRYGVVNADDPSAESFSGVIKNSISYGLEKGDVRAVDIKSTGAGSTFLVTDGSETDFEVKVTIPGKFNVYNALAAVAVGKKIGLTNQQIHDGIASLDNVEGRMNKIDEGQGFNVVVDFASTPDGFTKFFESMRPLVSGKLIAVFGSAGRRDHEKRSVQGSIAGQYADIVIATEEDDRDEDGAAILAEIQRGAEASGKIHGETFFAKQDREEAIKFALTLAKKPEDAVVILGKGHEKTIERADGEHEWSDIEVTRRALRQG